jgi:DNA-binding NtrC family response regulator
MPVDAVFEADCRNRLGAVMLVMPTLAERREDILPLARTFLKQFASEYNLDRTLNARAVEYIKTYAWPGNVRQLQSTLLNALIQAPGQTIRYEDLATFTGEARSEYEGGPVPTFQEQVENFERGLLQSVLEQCHGNQSQVSRMLQMNRGTLIRKIKQYELDACGRPGFWQSDTV